mgnify:CR=1 FL=1
MIKFVCDLCKKEFETGYGLGFEHKQSTKKGFYIEFSHSVDMTRLFTEKLICPICREQLRQAFSETVENLNRKIKNLEVKNLVEAQELLEVQNDKLS